MRPVANRQSALRSPLNDILGTEANVRLLRVLAATETPLTLSRLAEQTMLHISGIARAISALEEQGIVESVGAGARRPIQFHANHPLGDAIRALFRAERERFDSLINGLASAARILDPPPQSVWIEGPVVAGADRLHDNVVVGVLASAASLDRVVSSLENAIAILQRELDVTVEVRGWTVSDLTAAREKDREGLINVMPLLGPPPSAVLGSNRPEKPGGGADRHSYSHEELDARSRKLASAVAERIRDDPGIVEQARAYISERLDRAAPGEQRELREWEEILRTMSLPRLRRFLVDEGQRATRLRQTSPFTGVLTAEVREQLTSGEDGRDS